MPGVSHKDRRNPIGAHQSICAYRCDPYGAPGWHFLGMLTNSSTFTPRPEFLHRSVIHSPKRLWSLSVLWGPNYGFPWKSPYIPVIWYRDSRETLNRAPIIMGYPWLSSGPRLGAYVPHIKYTPHMGYTYTPQGAMGITSHCLSVRHRDVPIPGNTPLHFVLRWKHQC